MISSLYPNEFIIDDSNYSRYAPNADVIIDGKQYSRGLELPEQKPRSAQYTKNWDRPVIPRAEWKDRILEREKKGQILSKRLRAKGIPTPNQNGTNFCWTYGVVSNIIANRCWRNLPYVEFSRESVAAPIKGYRNNGGWGNEALEYIAQNGIMPQSLWPRYHFSSSQYNTTANLAEAAKFKVLEFLILQDRNFAQGMTALLDDQAIAVGYNWWSHEVCAVDPVVIGSNAFGYRIWNSWGDSYGDKGFAILEESKAIFDDGVIAVVTGDS